MSENQRKEHPKGLPGLLPIRERLKLSQAFVASMCGPKGRAVDSIRHIESGAADCSQQLQRELAAALCCTVANLHSDPTEAVLKEIEINYKRRELEQLEQGVA